MEPHNEEGGEHTEGHGATQTPENGDRERPGFTIACVNLTDTQKGPVARLIINEAHGQYAIDLGVDVQHSTAVKHLLEDAGFRWKKDEKTWVRKYKSEFHWRAQKAAVKVFWEVGEILRNENGCQPASGPKR